RRHPARAIAYEPDTEELELLAATERTLPSLRLSAFEVGHHRRTSDFGSTAMLVRYGLLKRAESSTSAFRASLLRLLRFLDAFAEAVSCGGYRSEERRVGKECRSRRRPDHQKKKYRRRVQSL